MSRLQVYFDVRQTNASSSTCPAQNTTSSSSDDDSGSAEASAQTPPDHFLGTLSLAHGVLTYNELTEDRNVLVYVPQGSFYPGSRFRVPIKLQIHSQLRQFVVK